MRRASVLGHIYCNRLFQGVFWGKRPPHISLPRRYQPRDSLESEIYVCPLFLERMLPLTTSHPYSPGATLPHCCPGVSCFILPLLEVTGSFQSPKWFPEVAALESSPRRGLHMVGTGVRGSCIPQQLQAQIPQELLCPHTRCCGTAAQVPTGAQLHVLTN